MPGKKKVRRRRRQRGGDFGNILWEKYRKMYPTWTNQQVSDYVQRDDRGFFGNLASGFTGGASVAVEVGKKVVPAVIEIAKKPNDPMAWINAGVKTGEAASDQIKNGKGRRRRTKKIYAGRGPVIIY
ncbi:MAG: hypothetical protein ACP5N7_05335 [Candidatus Pacearchaeota archaeon]